MKIVSISMNDELYDELEKFRKEMKFSGSSDVLRQGLNALKEENKTLERLKGHVDCVLFIVHKEAEKKLVKILHENENIIKTQVHTKLCNDNCLELFIIHSKSEKIKDMYNKIKKTKNVEYLKLFVP